MALNTGANSAISPRTGIWPERILGKCKLGWEVISQSEILNAIPTNNQEHHEWLLGTRIHGQAC